MFGWLVDFWPKLAKGFAEYNSRVLNRIFAFVQNFAEPLAYSGLSNPKMRLIMPVLKGFQEN